MSGGQLISGSHLQQTTWFGPDDEEELELLEDDDPLDEELELEDDRELLEKDELLLELGDVLELLDDDGLLGELLLGLGDPLELLCGDDELLEGAERLDELLGLPTDDEGLPLLEEDPDDWAEDADDATRPPFRDTVQCIATKQAALEALAQALSEAQQFLKSTGYFYQSHVQFAVTQRSINLLAARRTNAHLSSKTSSRYTAPNRLLFGCPAFRGLTANHDSSRTKAPAVSGNF